MRIKFTIGDSEILAELNEGPTAKKIAASLPINGAGNYWGEEFYFSVPVQSVYEPGASDVVEPGTVAFGWRVRAYACFGVRLPSAAEGNAGRRAKSMSWAKCSTRRGSDR
jgi:hypothetical protein